MRVLDRAVLLISLTFFLAVPLLGEAYVTVGEAEPFIPPEIYYYSLISMSIVTMVTSLLLFGYLMRTIRFIAPEVREQFVMFVLLLFFLFLNSLNVVLGWSYLYITKDPLGYIEIGSFRFYVFIVASAYVNLFEALIGYFLLRFSQVVLKMYSGALDMFSVSLFIIINVLAVHPLNYYGRYPPTDVFSLKPFTALAVTLYLLLAAMYGMVSFFAKAKKETGINRGRLLTIALGFAFLMLFQIFYIVYVVLLTRGAILAAMIFIVLTSLSGALALIAIYLGLVAPQFYMRFLRKKYAS